jgi:hypothetical protein
LAGALAQGWRRGAAWEEGAALGKRERQAVVLVVPLWAAGVAAVPAAKVF